MTYLEKKLIAIGLTVITTITIVILGYNYLKGNNPFKKDRAYYVIYSDIHGLNETAPVFISGKKVGQIKSIEFCSTDTNLIVIEIVIEDKIKIPSNSIAKIVSQDLLGTKVIAIIPNYSSHQWLKKGDTLKGKIEKPINELILEKLAPLEQTIENLNQVLININKTFDTSTITKLQNSISHLNNSLFVIDTLLSGYRLKTTIKSISQFSQNLAKQNDTITEILSQIKQILTQVNQAELKQTIMNLDSLIIYSKTIINQIQQGQGSLGKLYGDEEFYKKLDSLAMKINILLDEILSNPKHYIKVSIF